jgi:hypothetical protein
LESNLAAFSSSFLLSLSHSQNPNLKGSLAALYWAFTTLTTVGLGHRGGNHGREDPHHSPHGQRDRGLRGAGGLLAAYLVRGPREPEPDLGERLERVERKLEELSLRLESGNPKRTQRRSGGR